MQTRTVVKTEKSEAFPARLQSARGIAACDWSVPRTEPIHCDEVHSWNTRSHSPRTQSVFFGDEHRKTVLRP